MTEIDKVQVGGTSYDITNTKNTAGTTNKTGTKMFIVGATEQSANPQTYSNSNVYIGTDNCLYSGGTKVLTSHQDISGKVSGPSSATNNAVAIFDGTGGKTIKNSGFTIGKSVPSDAIFTDTTYSQISRGSGAGLAPGLPSGSGTTKYLREDGSWQVPPDTNTWRGIQDNLTSTSTTDSLSAAQGKVLNDKITESYNDNYSTFGTANTSGSTIPLGTIVALKNCFHNPDGIYKTLEDIPSGYDFTSARVSAITNGAITYLNDKIDNLLLVENKSPSSALSASVGAFDCYFDISKSGYTPLGIVGWSTENRSDSDKLNLSAVRIVNNTAHFYGKNTGSNAINITPVLTILYMKN